MYGSNGDVRREPYALFKIWAKNGEGQKPKASRKKGAFSRFNLNSRTEQDRDGKVCEGDAILKQIMR